MMTDLDLTEANVAVARELYGDIRTDAAMRAACDLVAPYVRAAAPIIERQVREQVAVEIEAARDWRANNFVGAHSSAISDTYSESACIARGES